MIGASDPAQQRVSDPIRSLYIPPPAPFGARRRHPGALTPATASSRRQTMCRFASVLAAIGRADRPRAASGSWAEAGARGIADHAACGRARRWAATALRARATTLCTSRCIAIQGVAAEHLSGSIRVADRSGFSAVFTGFFLIGERRRTPMRGRMVGRPGLEPGTDGLKVRCSTS